MKFIAELRLKVLGPEITAGGRRFSDQTPVFPINAETVRQISSKLLGRHSAQRLRLQIQNNSDQM